ncbi:MAG TPA: TonB-dependent receptor [Gemmatimonadaceae bacterium]|nr:TonB-dependent receptor [Gemmatimonadaceae bacterium]
MKMSRWMLRALALLAIPAATSTLSAQGITTAAVTGVVRDASGAPKADARVVAVHNPSGTTYQAITRADGRFTMPGMRVGGPYTVRAMALGSEPDVKQAIFLTLGVATELQFSLRTAAVQLAEVRVTGESETVFSSERTGAATAVQREVIATLPTISGRIEDFVRLTPQYSGAGFGFSFGGQDNRLNNVTIDGAQFNNSFGLAGQPGDRTNVAPISMDAIEQVQVQVAPFDVRQGNFVGAGVNTVTRSGTNEFRGSAIYSFRDNRRSLHGTRAGAATVNPGTFEFSKLGLSLGGPILKDKLFFFANFEDDKLESPATLFRANAGGEPVGGNVTRVLKSDLDGLSSYLATNFGYVTGPYQDYARETPATRYLGRLDYNLNERNKLSLRYSQLDSYTDVLASTSSSLGFGGRNGTTNALNFQNSNYQILENIKSFATELNSVVGSQMSNNVILTYSHHDESRGFRGSFFPMVDVLNGGSTYTTFGFEPFTPSNELRYGSWQLANNFTWHGNNHEITVGGSGEMYESENVFFPGSQSAYVYNSLADFYTDANAFLTACGTNQANWATCTRATSPVTLRRFQVRWANQPGMEKPVQPLEVNTLSLYAQDQWRVNDKLRLTGGIRLDRSAFGETGFTNTVANALTFRDEDGNSVQYATEKLPDPKILFSPRFGFNYDVLGDRTFQVRGGTGLFSGRPAYVWVSNQIGENGVLTGFQQLDNTTARPFHPDPDHYKPAASTITGAPASSFGLALTDPDYKFPQLWRTNIAADKRLPWGLVGTGEFLYSKDINGTYYIDANLSAADGAFAGPGDTRPRWSVDDCPTVAGTQQRINCNVTNAIVLKNQNVGYAWNASASLEKPFGLGTFLKAAYSYGVSKNTVDAGSIAFGSWNNNQHSGNPNDPGLGFANASPGHRLFLAGSVRRDFIRFGATTAAIFWEMRNNGSSSYTYSGDLNGDGGTSNDLIYIPKDASEMNFEQFTCTPTTNGNCATTTTFTVAQQVAAWEAFIQQDEYLSAHRGEYAERGAVFVPFVNRADVSLSQEIAQNVAGKRNAISLRLDFLNFGNLLNNNWGVGRRLVTTQPLVARGADGTGRALYRLRNIGENLITKTHEKTAGLGDVYRIQMTLRYSFN